jgi:hypothetical protein
MAKWYEYDPGPPEPFDHSDDGRRGWALLGLIGGLIGSVLFTAWLFIALLGWLLK